MNRTTYILSFVILAALFIPMPFIVSQDWHSMNLPLMHGIIHPFIHSSAHPLSHHIIHPLLQPASHPFVHPLLHPFVLHCIRPALGWQAMALLFAVHAQFYLGTFLSLAHFTDWLIEKSKSPMHARRTQGLVLASLCACSFLPLNSTDASGMAPKVNLWTNSLRVIQAAWH